jgi:hypothetical protein
VTHGSQVGYHQTLLCVWSCPMLGLVVTPPWVSSGLQGDPTRLLFYFLFTFNFLFVIKGKFVVLIFF